MDDGLPIAIHHKAIELACEGDRIWFEQNPGRLFRIRDAVPLEFNGRAEPPPADMTWRVVVAQIQPGARARLPVALHKGIPNEGADDRSLAMIFDQFAPKEMRKMLKRAHRKARQP